MRRLLTAAVAITVGLAGCGSETVTGPQEITAQASPVPVGSAPGPTLDRFTTGKVSYANPEAGRCVVFNGEATVQRFHLATYRCTTADCALEEQGGNQGEVATVDVSPLQSATLDVKGFGCRTQYDCGLGDAFPADRPPYYTQEKLLDWAQVGSEVCTVPEPTQTPRRILGGDPDPLPSPEPTPKPSPTPKPCHGGDCCEVEDNHNSGGDDECDDDDDEDEDDD